MCSYNVNSMENRDLKLKKQIMHRVYYSYSLRLLASPFATHGAVLLLSIFLMTYFVSFKDVFANLMQVPVGNLANYAFTSLMTTEVWTLILLGVATFSILSLRFRIHIPNLIRI